MAVNHLIHRKRCTITWPVYFFNKMTIIFLVWCFIIFVKDLSESIVIFQILSLIPTADLIDIVVHPIAVVTDILSQSLYKDSCSLSVFQSDTKSGYKYFLNYLTTDFIPDGGRVFKNMWIVAEFTAYSEILFLAIP